MGPANVNGSQYQSNVRLGGGVGSVGPVTVPKKKRSRGLVWLLVLALLGVGGWYAKDLVLGEDLPPLLADYDSGDAGYPYSSPTGGYTVVLPSEPTVTNDTLGALGATMSMSQAMSVTDDFAIGVAHIDLPPGAIIDPQLNLEGGAIGAASAAGGTITEQHSTTHQGYPAMDVTIDVPDGTGKLRMVLVGNRLYAAMAVSPHGSGPGFERLVESLQIG